MILLIPCDKNIFQIYEYNKNTKFTEENEDKLYQEWRCHYVIKKITHNRLYSVSANAKHNFFSKKMG
jgi:hypothetical protein